ncbi:MAG TPA: hypothetical protein EYH22_03355 [Candidatus Nanopusillus sp.]|nr:hypothetical protein [Candidatus Nanopusillus sp.]
MNGKILKELWKRGFIVSVDAIEFLKQIESQLDLDTILSKLQVENITIITKQTLEKIIKIDKNLSYRDSTGVQKDKSQKDNNFENIIHNKTSKNSISKNANGSTILKFIQQTTKIETKNKIKIEEKICIEIEKNTSNDIESPRVYSKLTQSSSSRVLICSQKKRFVGDEFQLYVDILKSYELSKHEISVNTWVSYYRARLNKIKHLLKNHSELSLFISFDQLKRDIEEVSVVGLVRDKRITSKGMVITLEDSKGLLKVFISQDLENFEEVQSVPLDTVVGIRGKYLSYKKLLIADSFFYPDIPFKKVKKGEDDVWIAFTGDFQVGNKNFLKRPFERFIRWLKGEYGSEKERTLARKVGYLVLTGDLIDGVGIYPNQEKELEIVTAEEQYAALERYFLEIPESIQVITIPGNHDVVRLAEPQPPIPKDFFPETYELENFFYVSNPAYVKIHRLLDILIYHGYSMDWFVSEVSWIRERGGYDKPEEIMKFMLTIRHLAPTHGCNPYVPYPGQDPLVIDPVPDIFVTGHIHRTAYAVYKGVELINASCFQGITQYQLELGHKPDPGKVVLRNIKTGEVKILNFLSS